MLKVIKIVFGVLVLLAILGTLGLSIVSLITVLNIQDQINDQFSATDGTTLQPSAITTKAGDLTNSVPAPVPVQQGDPRYESYKRMGEQITSWINATVNPCDDFWNYACGAGVKGQENSFGLAGDAITESMLTQLRQTAAFFDNYTSSYDGTFQPLPVRQMKWFYDSCMTGSDEAAYADRSKRTITDLRKANPDFGFPALYPTETKASTPKQLAAFLGYSLGSSGVTSLVDVGVDTDWKDPHNAKGGFTLLVDQPATFFTPAYYIKMYQKDDVVSGIVDSINSAALLLGIKNVDQKQLQKDAQDIAQLDFDLATKYSTDETTRRQYERSYNPNTVDGLQKLAPFVDWKTFLDGGLTPISKTVDGSFRSIVMEVDNLTKLSAAIASGEIASRTLNNYLYVVALNSLDYLPSADTLRKASYKSCTASWLECAINRLFISHTPYVGRSKSSQMDGFRRHKRPINRKIREEPRIDPFAVAATTSAQEANCQGVATNYFVWASNRLYVEANYPKAEDRTRIRDQAQSIIRAIIAAFRAQIDLLDWMSPASKKGAYQKIDNLVVNVAYPDWVLDDARLADYYKKLTTAQKDSYLDQIDALNAFGLYEAFSPLVRAAPADRTDFAGPAAITNAWYQPELNSITLPGGMLTAPIYSVNNPAAVNFGSIGLISGHELTHGFDDQGVQWEGTGMLSSWMDDNSTKAFTGMAQCVVDEYSKFCPLGDGNPCIDGAQTQGENIADNGGMQASYKAFKAYEALHGPDPLLPGAASVFNSDQLYFLGYAQVWCQYPPTAERLLKQILTDVHSPALYRVLGPIQNTPAFQKAFNCPVDSVYAPKDHCNVWTSEPSSGAPLNDKGEPMAPENEINIAPVERISPQEMNKYTVYQNALANFKAAANLTVDPCDDFYRYTCGAYPGPKTTFFDMEMTNNKIINDKLNAEDYQATIKGNSALTKLKNLYESCKVEAAQSTIGTTDYITPKVLAFRNAIDQDIPIIGGTGNIDITAENYGNALGYLSFKLGIDTLVTPQVDTNWVDPQGAKGSTDGYQLFVDQASQATTYNDRAFYEDENWKKQKDGYKNTVKTVLEAYVKKDTTAKLPADYDKMIDNALDLEKTIAITYSGTDEERREYKRQWNPKPLAAFPATVDWAKYWAMAPTQAQQWSQTKNIVMNEKDKTPQLLDFIDKADGATVVNYLFIRLILANSGLIPCASGECVAVMRQLAAKQVPEHTGRRRLPGRRHALPSFARLNDNDDDIALECADEAQVMADAQGRVYIDARFPTADDKNRIRRRVALHFSITGVMNNIVHSMKGMIDELDWMTEDSKALALNKASKIQVNAAFPDFILNDKQLNDKYADLVFDKDDSYYAMLDKVNVYSINEQYKLLTEAKANRADFLGQTALVDAWYDPELNSITFPAGILMPPYFDVDFPAAMNYGGIGVVAGHELTHGFDDEGIQWDFDGSLNSWMDQTSQNGFNAMAQCVIDEYGQFCPLPADRSPHCTDGVRTQGENIADNGGIHSSWRAYESHVELNGPDPLFMDRVFSQYSENQLYFLNFAQLWCMQKTYVTESYISDQLMTNPHSLGFYRVLGSLQNIPAFQANFNCPKGSVYAPEQHCSVWVPTKMA